MIPFYESYWDEPSEKFIIASLPNNASESGQLLRYNYYNETFDTLFSHAGDYSLLWTSGFAFQQTKDRLWMGVLSRNAVGDEFGGGIVRVDNISEYDPHNFGNEFKETSPKFKHSSIFNK